MCLAEPLYSQGRKWLWLVNCSSCFGDKYSPLAIELPVVAIICLTLFKAQY